MAMLRGLNGLVMFVLELAAYAAVGLAGWRLCGGGAVGAVLAALAVVVLALVWARWGAPRAARPVTGARRVVLEAGWFGCAALALVAIGYAAWALGFAVAWVVNLLLRRRAGQLP